MKITKSYLEKLIREQVELTMTERNSRYGPPSETSPSVLAGMMPANPIEAESIARDTGDGSLFHTIMTAINAIPGRDAKLAAIKKALKVSNKLSPAWQKSVLDTFKASPFMRSSNLEESKKSVNKTILEVHRKGRKLSPAVKNNWWQND